MLCYSICQNESGHKIKHNVIPEGRGQLLLSDPHSSLSLSGSAETEDFARPI